MTSNKLEPGQREVQTLRQIAQWGGLDLPPDHAATLLPGLQEILEVDARITELDLGVLTIVGLP